jgi:hypothetical protein
VSDKTTTSTKKTETKPKAAELTDSQRSLALRCAADHLGKQPYELTDAEADHALKVVGEMTAHPRFHAVAGRLIRASLEVDAARRAIK